eukprot:PLAT15224.1.p1 GENE.PLAT15224.1~~PLAT15224.1.p1  ORF type:complete len:161 (+),score=50.07 PLAT15224.1:452-934(+)
MTTFYPQDVMVWSEELYRDAFARCALQPPGPFRLEAQDYAFGGLKVGGNAQSLGRTGIVHHTSFLWDWQEHNMGFLKQPKKQPDYRQGREHTQFLTRLRDCGVSSTGAFFRSVTHELQQRFAVTEASVADARATIDRLRAPKPLIRGVIPVDLTDFVDTE